MTELTVATYPILLDLPQTDEAKRKQQEDEEEAFAAFLLFLLLQLERGNIDEDEFLLQAGGAVRMYHWAAAVTAKGTTQLDSYDWAIISFIVATQYYFLRGLSNVLAEIKRAGEAFTDGIRTRLGLYAKAQKATYWRVWSKVQGRSEYVRWRLGIAEHCTDCIERDGKVWRVDQIPFYPGDGNSACYFKSGQVSVLTAERGFIPLSSVLVGESVLTHKGRFRAVKALTELRVKDKPAVTLRVEFGGVGTTQTVTADHLFLTSNGQWVRADSVHIGDRLTRVGRQCEYETCENIVNLERNDSLIYCSHACKNKAIPSVEAAHARVREMVANGEWTHIQQWRKDHPEEYAVANAKAGEAGRKWRTGKTYEELYSPEVAARTRVKVGKYRKGKTLEELVGCDRAKELRERGHKRMVNGYAKEIRALRSDSKPGKLEERFTPQEAAAIRAKISRRTRRQWKESRDKLRAAIVDGSARYWSGHTHTHSTKPELAMGKILASLAVPFEPQVSMLGRYCVDFYLPEQNVAVEVDGEYWHTRPGVPERDRRRDKEIKLDNGIDVLRFWAADILERPDQVRAQLERVLANHSGKYVVVGDAVVTQVKHEQRNGIVRCLVVEEDESFVTTNGFVSHNCLSNCKCSLERVPTDELEGLDIE